MAALLNATRQHIHEVLGIAVPEAKAWARQNDLPYFLKDAFRFSQIQLLGQPVVLAVGIPAHRLALSDVRHWLTQVRELAGAPVIYVTDALASYERRRLIELKVPFIVPGNQLYVPDLGLDLREYFRQPAPMMEALSPSSQALLITALLRPVWKEEWRPAETAADLGYTPMTVSRVIKELAGAGLASVHTTGRSRYLVMAGSPQALWERARPALRTPVRKSFWVADHYIPADYPHRLAGLSALAQHSMLADPPWPVVALSGAGWKAAYAAGVREVPEPRAGAQEWQVWSYSPALVSGTPTVDPLSLTLSLQDDADERVQLALDELREHIQW